MKRKIAHMALIVSDYDEAIAFYTQILNFKLIEDTKLNEKKRWVLVSPNNKGGTNLLLAKAQKDEEKAAVGNQSGGRVFLFLYTNDFEKEYQNLLAHNVKIVREPKNEPYGTVAVFADLYGNLWDLIQPSTSFNEG